MDAGQIVVRLAKRAIVHPRIDVVGFRRAQITRGFRDFAQAEVSAGRRILPIMACANIDRLFKVGTGLLMVSQQ